MSFRSGPKVCEVLLCVVSGSLSCLVRCRVDCLQSSLAQGFAAFCPFLVAMERFLRPRGSVPSDDQASASRATRQLAESELAAKIGVQWPPPAILARRPGRPTHRVLYADAVEAWIRHTATQLATEDVELPSRSMPPWWIPGMDIFKVHVIVPEPEPSEVPDIEDLVEDPADAEPPNDEEVAAFDEETVEPPAKKRNYTRPCRELRNWVKQWTRLRQTHSSWTPAMCVQVLRDTWPDTFCPWMTIRVLGRWLKSKDCKDSMDQEEQDWAMVMPIFRAKAEALYGLGIAGNAALYQEVFREVLTDNRKSYLLPTITLKYVRTWLRTAGFRYRAPSGAREKVQSEGRIAADKSILKQRIAWICNMYQIKTKYIFNVDETGCKFLSVARKGAYRRRRISVYRHRTAKGKTTKTSKPRCA